MVRLTGKTMTIPREVYKQLYNPVETKQKCKTCLNVVTHQAGNTLIPYSKERVKV